MEHWYNNSSQIIRRDNFIKAIEDLHRSYKNMFDILYEQLSTDERTFEVIINNKEYKLQVPITDEEKMRQEKIRKALIYKLFLIDIKRAVKFVDNQQEFINEFGDMYAFFKGAPIEEYQIIKEERVIATDEIKGHAIKGQIDINRESEYVKWQNPSLFDEEKLNEYISSEN